MAGKPEIVASYVVCNEEVLIAESVRSVKAYVDRFVFVDVVFTTNQLQAMHSTDRTRKRAQKAAYPVPVTYVESDRKMALDEARNLALSLCDGWALILDGDETLLGAREDVEALLGAIRSGEVTEPIGVLVYTSALTFDGHAPSITETDYQTLPVIYTRGVQHRLLSSKGAEWRPVPSRGAFGLYSDGAMPSSPPTDAFVIVNHRTRQSFAAYQHDYIWETATIEAGRARWRVRDTDW
jgi:hypothetical protein